MPLASPSLDVLIIEDNKDYAAFIQMILQRVSDTYHFTITHTLTSAIQSLSVKMPDVIISDLGLPDNTGLENIKKLRLVASDTPLLILTNVDDEHLGIEAINLGADEYLPKRNIGGPLLHRMILHAVERKRILNTLEKQRIQLLHAQKMEAIVTLVGGITHDFNNILTLILGYAELINNEASAGATVHKYNHQIQSAAKRAAQLIEKLSTFSQAETSVPEIININDYLVESSDLFDQILRDDIEREMKLPSHPSFISINRTNLEQILVNIILNARQAIEGTGLVTIAVEQTHGCPYCEKTGPMVLLNISDTGCGIPPEHLEKIFDPYFTTKPHGSGLGLATVFGLVQQVHGCVDINSQVGSGTTVILGFPAKQEIPELENKAHTDVTDHQASILLLDDDPKILTLLESLLDETGYIVQFMTNPIKALEQITSGGLAPDIIITDVVMPKMSGIEFSTEVRELNADLPILLMSGYSPEYYRQYDHLDLELLHKPFTRDQLLQKLHELLS